MGSPFKLIQQMSPAKSGQAIAATTNVALARPCSMFIPNVNTVDLVCALEDDPTTMLTITLGAVAAGVPLALRIVEFDATNGASGVALFTDSA